MFISHTQLSNYPASQRVILKRYFSSEKFYREESSNTKLRSIFSKYPFYININILRSLLKERKSNVDRCNYSMHNGYNQLIQ